MDQVVVPPAVASHLSSVGLGNVVSFEKLEGGCISLTRRLTTSAGRTFVLKQGGEMYPGIYVAEAHGLTALASADGPRVPRVLSVAEDHILLEDLGPKTEPRERYWREYGRAVAQMHANTAPQYGFDHPSYLGGLPVSYDWCDDPHEFFIRHSILRFLAVPLCSDLISSEERSALDRLAVRLPEFVPKQGPSLVHGDLWHANMLVGPNGKPAAVDPSAHYGLPEAELAVTRLWGGVPDEFYAAYLELHPLEPGWGERLAVLQVGEFLGNMAHFGERASCREPLRELLKRFM